MKYEIVRIHDIPKNDLSGMCYCDRRCVDCNKMFDTEDHYAIERTSILVQTDYICRKCLHKFAKSIEKLLRKK